MQIAVAELQNEEVQQAQAQAQAESAPWPTPGPDIVRRCVTGHNGEEPWRGTLDLFIPVHNVEAHRES